jgi:mannose-6-phosphate isomerase-like protein (cupin superfamily)
VRFGDSPEAAPALGEALGEALGSSDGGADGASLFGDGAAGDGLDGEALQAVNATAASSGRMDRRMARNATAIARCTPSWRSWFLGLPDIATGDRMNMRTSDPPPEPSVSDLWWRSAPIRGRRRSIASARAISGGDPHRSEPTPFWPLLLGLPDIATGDRMEAGPADSPPEPSVSDMWWRSARSGGDARPLHRPERYLVGVLGYAAVMDAWELDELEAARDAGGRLYHEFISVPGLSGGLYVLDAGATDPQSPHTEDELYVVMSGTAKVMVGGEVRPIQPGSVIFVAANVEHTFHDIEERLVLLVMFGPAEYSRQST